ncbi:MAG: carboxypeptidase regulatory-like domain-containing protein, partial [Bryobacteraceae bacterium]
MTKLLLFTLIAAGSLLAQLNRGTITGNVTDASGSAIPSVKVTATSAGTGQATVTTANEFGQYSLPNLVTGTYTLTYEAANFKKSVRERVELGVTQVLRIDIPLELGSVIEVVSVTSSLPKLQTDSPEVGTSLDNKQLLELPLTFSGARLAETFAYKVTPGVSSNTWTSNINGSTAFSKESLLDGATVTTYLSGHFGESSVSVEALQEFRIQTSGMSAEFGRAQSGVFNYVMKSGQNQIHGSVYGALRNEAFNANTFANKFRGQPRGRDRRQNFAFSFGGPVVIPKIFNGHNKTFFYATYEKYRERLTGFAAPNTTAPQPEWLDGNMSRLLQTVIPGTTDALDRQVVRGAIYDPNTFRQLPNGRWIGDIFPNNTIPVSRFSQVSRNVLAMVKNGYLPVVKNPDGAIPLVNNAVRPSAGTPEFDQNQFSSKGDQMLSSTMRLSGSYSFTNRPRLLLDQTRLWNPADPMGGPLTSARQQIIKSQLARVAHDWNVSPAILNNFTVYYNRMANPNQGAFRNIDGAKELGIRNLSTFGYPNINWGGGPFVGLTNIGDPQNDFQVYMGFGLLNTTSFSRGKHFFKAGIDVRHNHLNTRPTHGGSFNFNARSTAIPNEAISGTQTGYAFASFLLGIVDSGSLSDPVGLGGRREYLGLFFQDDWKVTSRLTLNLGLRWEYQPPFMEVADRVSSWRAGVRDPLSGRNGAYQFAGNCSGCTGGRYFGSNSLRDFGPRIGFAWLAGEKWTFRGSYGIMYEGDLFNGFSGTPLGKSSSVQVGGTWNLNADAVNPWAGIFNWDTGVPANRFVPPSYDVSWGNNNRPGMIDPNYGRTAYTQMWNLNMQRQLATRLVLDIGYVANKATGIRAGELGILNQIDPSLLQSFGRNLLNQVRNPAEAAANGIA